MIGNGSAAGVAVALLLAVGGASAADHVPQEVSACAVCHGPDGNAPDPAMPSLAGQPAQFLFMQMFLFREGERNNPQMSPVAARLSNTDLHRLAAYFSAQKPASPAHRTDPANAAAGRILADRHHCTQCHGHDLLGQQHIPRLAGQSYTYLKAQLIAYKTRARTDPDGAMATAAQALTENNIDLLADYLAGLGAP